MSENARRVLRRDSNPHLFRPVTFRAVTARNRIMLSPMCQYSARDGVPDDWHLVHLGARAAGGAGIVMTEATHVEANGRITSGCLGIWNDDQRDAFARIADFIGAQGAVPGMQLAHAGRKGSVTRPWEGTRPIGPAEGGWPVIGPSEAAYSDEHPVPAVMTTPDIADVAASFGAGARRAREAGFQLLEIHAGHGYLIHQFLSPLSNRRADAYGGSFENRVRFLLDVIASVRAEWPASLPLFVRLSCREWVADGWDLDDTIKLAHLLAGRGEIDLIDCSSGGNDRRQSIPLHPGYQVPFAEAVRRGAGIATGAVGLLHSAEMAEEIVANGRADIVVLGRALLADPHWPLRAANSLKADTVDWPVQYERSNIF